MAFNRCSVNGIDSLYCSIIGIIEFNSDVLSNTVLDGQLCPKIDG
jgi:hypothetical protein